MQAGDAQTCSGPLLPFVTPPLPEDRTPPKPILPSLSPLSPFLASLHLKAIMCNPFLPRVSIIRSSQVIFMGFSKCYNYIRFVHYCQGGFTIHKKMSLLNDEKTFDLPKMYFPFTPYNRILGPKEEPIEDFP